MAAEGNVPVDGIDFKVRKWNRGHQSLAKFGSQWCPLFHFLPSKLIASPGRWVMEDPYQFFVGQSLTCSIVDEPHTGLEDCMKILPSLSSYWASGGGRS